MGKRNKRFRDDGSEDALKQAEKLRKVVRAIGPYRADHLNKKVRRLCEDAMDIFWSAHSDYKEMVLKQVARLIVCAVTGYRGWDRENIRFDDERIQKATDVLREVDGFVYPVVKGVSPAANLPAKTTTNYSHSKFSTFGAEKDEVLAAAVSIDQAIQAALDDTVEIEISQLLPPPLPDEAPTVVVEAPPAVVPASAVDELADELQYYP